RLGRAESRARGRVQADVGGRWSAVARWLGEGGGVGPAAGCRGPHAAPPELREDRRGACPSDRRPVPGQRKRYLGQLQVLARTPVRGSLIFAAPITAIGEAQLRTWLIEWDRLRFG